MVKRIVGHSRWFNRRAVVLLLCLVLVGCNSAGGKKALPATVRPPTLITSSSTSVAAAATTAVGRKPGTGHIVPLHVTPGADYDSVYVSPDGWSVRLDTAHWDAMSSDAQGVVLRQNYSDGPPITLTIRTSRGLATYTYRDTSECVEQKLSQPGAEVETDFDGDEVMQEETYRSYAAVVGTTHASNGDKPVDYIECRTLRLGESYIRVDWRFPSESAYSDNDGHMSYVLKEIRLDDDVAATITSPSTQSSRPPTHPTAAPGPSGRTGATAQVTASNEEATVGRTATSRPQSISAPGVIGVASQRTINLPDGNKILSLSPDGRWLAVIEGASAANAEALCVFDVALLAEQACADLAATPIPQVDPTSVAWSPDSTRLAFTEDSLADIWTVNPQDSDLWIMAAASGHLTNLTDDGYEGPVIDRAATPTGKGFTFKSISVPLDFLPAWSADGRTLFFGRSRLQHGVSQGTDIERIAASGGPSQKIVTVSSTVAFAIFQNGIHPVPNGQRLLFTEYDPFYESNSNDGIWIVNSDGSGLHRLLAPPGGLFTMPILLHVSATGDRGLVCILCGTFENGRLYPIGVLDLATGRVEPIAPVADSGAVSASSHTWPIDATFSPDGTQVLYTWPDAGNSVRQRLFVRDLASGAEQVLGDGIAIFPLEDWGRRLEWRNDATVFGWTTDNTLDAAVNSASPAAAVANSISPSRVIVVQLNPGGGALPSA